MSGDDWVKIIGAISAAAVTVLAAIGVLWRAVHGYRAEVNGRLSELLELTRTSSRAEGALDADERRGPPGIGYWNPGDERR